jgi:xanthine dehydrogenase YagR molybdenum-binding subunit
MPREIAMDEMAEKPGMNPVEFRVVNNTQVDPNTPQRRLGQCLRQDATRFG